MRQRSGALLLSAGTAVAVLSAALAEPASAAIVKAQVERENGRPLRERWVWVVWDTGAPFRFERGKRRVLNPRGQTKRDGTLRVEIPAGFFAPGDELALAWEEKDGGRTHFTALHGPDGKRLRFTLDAVGRERDFGKLIAPAPEPD